MPILRVGLVNFFRPLCKFCTLWCRICRLQGETHAGTVTAGHAGYAGVMDAVNVTARARRPVTAPASPMGAGPGAAAAARRASPTVRPGPGDSVPAWQAGTHSHGGQQPPRPGLGPGLRVSLARPLSGRARGRSRSTVMA